MSSSKNKSFSNNLRNLQDSDLGEVEFSQTTSYRSSTCASPVKENVCKLKLGETTVKCAPYSMAGASLTVSPPPVRLDLGDLDITSHYVVSPKKCVAPAKKACGGATGGASAMNATIPYVSGGAFLVVFIVSLILLGWYKPAFVLKDCPQSDCPELHYGKLIGWSLLIALIFIAAMAAIYAVLYYAA